MLPSFPVRFFASFCSFSSFSVISCGLLSQFPFVLLSSVWSIYDLSLGSFGLPSLSLLGFPLFLLPFLYLLLLCFSCLCFGLPLFSYLLSCNPAGSLFSHSVFYLLLIFLSYFLRHFLSSTRFFGNDLLFFFALPHFLSSWCSKLFQPLS